MLRNQPMLPLDEDSVVFAKKAIYLDDLSYKYVLKEANEPNHQTLFLLSQICERDFYENMPKTFTISTKNSTLHFNTQMLKETSPVISKFIQDNPNTNNYKINITDYDNILTKFEQLYQGKTMIFKDDEFPLIQQFTNILRIKNCPNKLKPEILLSEEIDTEGYPPINQSATSGSKINDLNVVIYEKWFLNFLKRDEYKVFKIKTNKKEYECNIFAVYTSNIIRRYLEKDPTAKEFEYKFDDKNDAFQLICDFFNYKRIDLKSFNIDSIKSIAEDLQINCILKTIDYFNDHQNEFNQIKEKHKNVIDSIEELFDLLYNINNYGIEKVKYSIVQSKWSKKDKNVEELSAFILQVVKPSFSLQKEMADLLIELNKESNEDNQLDLLIPFTVKKLMTLYWPHVYDFHRKLNKKESINRILDEIEDINLNNRCVYSFIRILYKRGIIPKEEIIKNLKNYPLYNNVFNAFFLPEIVEVDPKNFYKIAHIDRKYVKVSYQDIYTCNGILCSIGHCNLIPKFAQKYLPDKIDLYERMLDSMEPDDELTKSIIHDDVDTLQRIINQEGIDIENYRVPYNIFDDFEEEQKLINYTALRGSLKCFKYIKLNGSDIDEDTTYFSIFGGNNEIIKIVEQSNSNDVQNKIAKSRSTLSSVRNKENISFWFYLRSLKKRNYFSIYAAVYDKYNDDNVQCKKKVNGDTENDITIDTLNYVNINNEIASTIAMHKNELFDSTFKKLFIDKNKYGNKLDHIATLSIINGNVHALLTLIENGYHVTKSDISFAAKNGFYSLTKLLLDLYDKKTQKEHDSFNYKFIVEFDSVSIFELFITKFNQFDLTSAVLYAIYKNNESIVKYAFDNLNKFDFIQYNKKFIFISLNYAIQLRTNELFDFLIDQFKKLNSKYITFELISYLLNQACLWSNLPIAKTITDFILKENPNYDFTDAFINAAKSKSNDICQFFFDRKLLIDFKNCPQITEFGAVDVEIYKKIINNVEPNIKFLFNDCIHEAIQNKNIEVIDFILKENLPVQTELVEAVQTDDIEVVDLILKYNSKPTFINQKNSISTPLNIAAKNKNLEIVKRLLSIPGIDPSLYDTCNKDALTIATENYDIDIIDAILNFYGDDIENHVDLTLIASGILKFSCYDKIIVPNNAWKIIKRFASCKLTYITSRVSSIPFLCIACYYNKIDVVEYLLGLENIDPNCFESNSFNTPLTTAIGKNNKKIAELLIKHPKTNINLKNSKNESPLMIAIVNNHKEIIDLLIKDERFDPIESRLNFAFIYANKEISDQLYSLSFLDVNEQFDVPYSLMKVNSLIHSVKINDVEKIDKIISHRSFDIYKSGVKKAIFISAKKNNIEVFRKLIELIENDVNIINEQRQSLLACASKNLSGNIVDEILNNEHFENKNDQLLTAFIQTYSEGGPQKLKKFLKQKRLFDFASTHNFDIKIPLLQDTNQDLLNQESIPEKSSMIEIMKKLIEYDREHESTIKFDSILPNGKRFFTTISKNFSDIGDVCHFLISEGVDVNKPDSNNVYPLEHAIEIDSIEMVQALVNTEKIAKLELPGGNTYLHCAAFHKNPTILSFLLERKINDLNAANELGETPLFEACKAKCIDNIYVLFAKDDLDYLHKNQKGVDALDTVIQLPPNEVMSIKQNRDKYYSTLISTIEEKIISNE